MLTMVAKFRVRPGTESQAEQALAEMIEYVRAAEPGTTRYVLHRGANDPTQLLMYEQYADQGALDAHGTSPAIQKLFAVLGPLLDGRPTLEMYREVAGKK